MVLVLLLVTQLLPSNGDFSASHFVTLCHKVPIISETGSAICTAVVVVLSFGVVYQAWTWQRNSIKFCATLRKSEADTLAMIRQAFEEESTSRTHRKTKLTETEKRRDRLGVKSRARSSFPLFTKNCNGRPNSQFWIPCNVLWWLRVNGRRLALNFGDRRTGCCIMTTHHLTLPFSQGNFLPKAIWLSTPTHCTFIYFPDWR
jgi:hypothetical protein